jgi:hypothetical protein
MPRRNNRQLFGTALRTRRARANVRAEFFITRAPQRTFTYDGGTLSPLEGE